MFDLLAAAWLLASARAIPSPDSLGPHHVVRQFSPVEVEGSRLSDPAAVETVHELSRSSLSRLPVGSLRDAIALQPGVVAVGEDLHVRGGRAGETALTLLGLPLDDPRTGVPFELPLFAVRSAALLTGTLDADRAGSLAGDLEVNTEVPTTGFHPRVRWSGDGENGRNIDVAHASLSGPLARTGIGLAAAAEARFDDLGLPDVRSPRRTRLLGYAYDWRNDNHMLAWAKLAPTDRPQRASLELVLNRIVRAPYDPMFTYDGWITFRDDSPAGFDLTPQAEDAGSIRYRAADHVAMTEERRWALVGSASLPAAVPVRLSAGWLHTRTQTSVDLRPGAVSTPSAERVLFGPYNQPGMDPFHAVFGDVPYSLLASADRAMARADAVTAPGRGQVLRLGAGGDWERVHYAQVDEAGPIVPTVSTVRTYRASAPGLFAYGQHRWEYAGLLLSDGLRLQRFSAGVAGARPRWSLSPRLGIAYPISVRDAFSFSYARIVQDPQRDVLYDDRAKAYDRHPLGNPLLQPSEAIAWQAAVKHILDAAWSTQVSVFERDVWGEPGARNAVVSDAAFTLRYENADEAHATGAEFDVTHTSPGGSRVRAGYTFLNAWGSMSSPDGIAYGNPFGARPLPTGTHPLDWDLRHAFVLEATLRPLRDWTLGWATRAASGRPWTPLYHDADTSGAWPPIYADQSLVNSRRLAWSEATSLTVGWYPSGWRGLHVGLMVLNLFDHRGQDLVTLSGYPNSSINTLYDEYAAYRTDTGKGGGAYWNGGGGQAPGWHPVNDPRLAQPHRSIQLEIGFGD